MKLKMQRKGTFDCWTDTSTQIANQCGRRYKDHAFLYEVEVTATEKSLNQQGFLVDNNEIQRWFEREFGFERKEALDVLPSCERIAMSACDRIKELVKGCKRVVVRISGNDGGAWLESEWKRA